MIHGWGLGLDEEAHPLGQRQDLDSFGRGKTNVTPVTLWRLEVESEQQDRIVGGNEGGAPRRPGEGPSLG